MARPSFSAPRPRAIASRRGRIQRVLQPQYGLGSAGPAHTIVLHTLAVACVALGHTHQISLCSLCSTSSSSNSVLSCPSSTKFGGDYILTNRRVIIAIALGLLLIVFLLLTLAALAVSTS